LKNSIQEHAETRNPFYRTECNLKLILRNLNISDTKKPL
jgi:hypothetical protein